VVGLDKCIESRQGVAAGGHPQRGAHQAPAPLKHIKRVLTPVKQESIKIL